MGMFLSVVAGQGGVKAAGAPGTLSLSAGSDAYTQIDLSWSEVDGQLKFLPDVREALIPYRRMRFGQ